MFNLFLFLRLKTLIVENMIIHFRVNNYHVSIGVYDSRFEYSHQTNCANRESHVNNLERLFIESKIRG